jgi:hypothetical protein
VRATRAYITSFGTTGTLIVSALLTMSVMSAVVGFNGGFPSPDTQNPIGSVLVKERQTSLPVAQHPAVAPGTGFAEATGRVRSASREHHRRGTHAPVAHATPNVQPNSVTPQQATQPATPVSDPAPVVRDVTKALPTAPSVPAPASLLSGLAPGSGQAQSPVAQLPAVMTGVTDAVTNTVDKLLGH